MRPDRAASAAALALNRQSPPQKTRTHIGVLERRKGQVIALLCAGLSPGEIIRILEDPEKNKKSAVVVVTTSAIEAFRGRHSDEIEAYRAKMDEVIFDEAIHIKAERLRRYESMDRAMATVYQWARDGGRPDPVTGVRTPLPDGLVQQLTSIVGTRTRILRLVAEEQGDLPRRPDVFALVGERGGEVREDGVEMPVVSESMTIVYERTYENVNVADIG